MTTGRQTLQPVAAYLVITYAAVAGILLVIRLVIRKPRKWWLDDLLATIAVLAMIMQAIVVNRKIVTAFTEHNQKVKIFYLYANSICFYFEDWCARLSILYSIIRIVPGEGARRILHRISIAFYIGLLLNTFLMVGFCATDHSWQHETRPVCNVPKPIPIYQIVAGVLADTVLVFYSMQILRMLTSAPVLRRRLMIIFSSSVFITLACVTQSVCFIYFPGLPGLIAGETEGFVSLVVQNLPVLVVAAMHLLGVSNGLEPPRSQRITTNHFTTSLKFRQPTVVIESCDTGMTGVTSSRTEGEEDKEVLNVLGIKSGESRESKSLGLTTLYERWNTLDVDDLAEEGDGVQGGEGGRDVEVNAIGARSITSR